MITTCEKCGELVFNDSGKCYCEPFKVYYPEYYGDEEYIVHGRSFESVAEKVAEEINEENDLGEIFEAPIKITDPSGAEKYFKAYAEADINYYSSEVHP